MRYVGESGVYVIRNVVNGKVYVGSSIDVQKRYREHFGALRRGDHRCEGLQRAWQKYSSDVFIFEVAEFCDVEDLIVREQLWIDNLKAADSRFGYNSRAVAESNYGTHRSEETKRKIGDAHRGKLVKQQQRDLVSAYNKERNLHVDLHQWIAKNGPPAAKLAAIEAQEICDLKADGYNNKYLAERFDVDRSTISRVSRGVTSHGDIAPKSGRVAASIIPVDLDVEW